MSSETALALLIIGSCFAGVTVAAGIVGMCLGIPVFGGLPARAPLPRMPEVNPKYLRRQPPTGGEE